MTEREIWSPLARLAILSLSSVLGCSTPDSAKSPAQIVEENSTLLQELRSFKDSEQRKGIARIEKLGREQGGAVCLYLLSDPTLEDYRAEVVLARILAEWKDPRAIGYLLRNLSTQDRGAAQRASEGLVVFGDKPQVLDALKEMLERPVVAERLIAAETLAKIGGPKVVEAFLGRWKAEADTEVRAVFLVNVIGSKHPGRKAFLVDALIDADAAIRAEAWQALSRYPDVPRVAFAPDGALEDRARDVAVLRIWAKNK